MEIRCLNDDGILQFEKALAQARDAGDLEHVLNLRNVESMTTRIPGVTVDEVVFDSKLHAAKYLSERLAGFDRSFVSRSRGLWAWLALYYFEQLVQQKDDGTWKIGESPKYIPSADHRREYRHLLKAPFRLYTIHGDRARLLLDKPLNVWSDLEEQLTGIRELARMPGGMQAADILYYDAKKHSAKKGATNRSRAGNVRRLGAVLKQLDLTYDLYGMSGEELVTILPSEFDGFRK